MLPYTQNLSRRIVTQYAYWNPQYHAKGRERGDEPEFPRIINSIKLRATLRQKRCSAQT